MEVGAAIGLAAGLAGILGLQLNITFQIETRWTAINSRLATIESTQNHQNQAIVAMVHRVEKMEERHQTFWEQVVRQGNKQ